ncbi:hypothetical protein [Arcobacter sp. LA11]|uniref:hypothetical protein n=1 Tax=Arcobacter sp. LA11 TaxID=1898176 RepID=UPI0009330780|nr:hypothetical protein [Arcobacter sp. LA11]
MNLKKLKNAEELFFELYPKGFADELLQPIIKRHNIPKLSQTVQELFTKDSFGQPELICESFTKIVSRSSMISLFEKPKVRDMVKSMSIEQKDIFSISLYNLLYEDKEDGFESLVEILAMYKLAKWSIISIIPYYLYRDKEFFIKPTTTKNIIKFFDIENVVYKPRPSYEFYVKYKKVLEKMKPKVKKSLREDNAFFTGFLMIVMEEFENIK